MQSELISALRRILAFVRAVNDEPRENGGLPRNQIKTKFQAIKLEPTAELVELYSWRNGIDYLDAFLQFLDLDSAIRAYQGNKELKEKCESFKWEKSWFTILDMNGDVQICVDINSGQLFSVDVECDETLCIAANYWHYISAIIELFESGNYGFDSEAGCISVENEFWTSLQNKHHILNAWQ